MVRRLFTIITFFAFLSGGLVEVLAQTPNILSVSRLSSTMGRKIRISGNGFGTNISDLRVTFGATQGKVVEANDNVIEVLVPSGATYNQISVTNISSKKTGYADGKYLLSFNGEGISTGQFGDKIEIQEEEGLFDICAADFDNDGLNDFVTTNVSDLVYSTSVTVFKNTTADADLNISFSKLNDPDLNIAGAARNVTCGDLNGDGLMDLIVGKGGSTADRLYLFKNTSPGPGIINFAPYKVLILIENESSSSTRRIKVHDLDGDGLPEIIMTDQAGNKLFVFVNRSENGEINFPDAEKIILPTENTSLGLDIADLNKDGKPEILFGSNLASNLYYFPNKSVPGNVIFGDMGKIPIAGSNLVNLVASDFDGDGDNDIAVANFINNTYIITNLTSTGDFKFSSPKSIETGELTWGVQVGDMDGDSKPDLLVSTNSEAYKLTLLKNVSANGQISFYPYDAGEADGSRNMAIADFNKDGRPDFAYTVNNKNKVKVFRNKGCVISEITPQNPGKICSGKPVDLYATYSNKMSYEWYNTNGDVVATTPAAAFADPGAYAVKISNVQDGCSSTSGPVTLELGGTTLPPTPIISGPNVVCEGDGMILETAAIDNVSYYWQKPDESIVTSRSITIGATQTQDAGRYSLVLEAADGCRTDPANKIVQVSSLPNLEIATSESELFCEGTTNTLSVTEIPNAKYVWYKNGLVVSGANTFHYTASESGTFKVFVTNQNNCSGESNTLSVTKVQKITASFESQDGACLETNVAFTNTSIYDATVPVVFNWDFGEGNTSTSKSPTHIYKVKGTYPTTLKVDYEQGICASSASKNITISEDLGLVIKVDGASVATKEYQLCDGDYVELSVNANSNEVEWSTGSKNETIMVSEGGVYSVTSGAGSGCVSMDEILIEVVPNVDVKVISSDVRVDAGGFAQLGAEGADFYRWEPQDLLDNPNIANPSARPTVRTTFYVEGWNQYDCKGIDSVTVFVNEKDRGIKVDAARIFSPNGDGKNDIWQIKNLNLFEGCNITIVNRRGQTVYNSVAYANDWDGTSTSGDELPEGDYYYIMICGESENHSGDVTIVR